MAVDIAQVIQEIKEEAEKRRHLPVHPDRKLLKSTKIRIRPPKAPLTTRIFATLRREKFGALRRLYRVPIVGYSIRWLVGLIRLPVRLEQLHTNITLILPRLDNLENTTRSLKEEVAQITNQELSALKTNHHLQWLETIKALKRVDAVEGELRELASSVRASSSVIFDSKAQLKMLMERDVRGAPQGTTATYNDQQDDHDLDFFYIEFENRFRGSQDQIRAKLSQYLALFEKSTLDFAKEKTLDIGCGRGEWLKLLSERGYPSLGIDSNISMVEQCKSGGLNAVVADATAFLREQKSESLGCVTGFHIVEHLSFKTLIRLIDEVIRVLKPGGMIIFETPNPENIIVGSCNFYTDPTHKNPIPPHSLAFFLEQRGMQNHNIMRLSPVHRDLHSSDPLVEEIAARFYCAQDYAVVAYKN